MFSKLQFSSQAESSRIPHAERDRRNRLVLSPLLMALTILSTSTKALEPYDPAQATHWPGVEVIAPEKAGIGRKVADVDFFELHGKQSSLYHLTGDKGMVIVVRDPECPVSVRYGPRVASMARDYSQKGFSFAFIYLNERLDAERLDRDAEALHAPATKIGRGSFAIANALDVKSTGEVFVLDSENRLLYRGAIDDQYGFGYTQDAPTHNYLRNALDAELHHWPIDTPATLAPGCAIDADPQKDDFLPIPPDAALS